MTVPEGAAQDPSTAAAAAAPQTPATAPDLVTGHGPPVGQAPAPSPPRTRRRRWPVVLLAAVVVLGLAAGLVVWAPWTQTAGAAPHGAGGRPLHRELGRLPLVAPAHRPAAGQVPDPQR